MTDYDVLTGLQQLYGFTWETVDASPTFSFRHLFRRLMGSYHRTVEPVARYAEAGLLNGQLREAGLWEDFEAGMARIEQNREQSAEAHVDIMTDLLTAALGDRSTKGLHQRRPAGYRDRRHPARADRPHA